MNIIDNNTKETKNKRIDILDALRGFGVVLMIIFHFCFDLTHFGYANIDITYGWFWIYFRFVIIGIFAFCVGYSFNLAHKNNIALKKFNIILLKLFVSACLVSISTYFLFPTKWVYFGILHFIFVSYFLLFFIHKLKIIYLLFFSGLLFCLSFFEIIDGNFVGHLAIKYLNANITSVDIVAFVPWFCVILLGLVLGKLQVLNKINLNYKPYMASSFNALLFLGKNALVIYLIHQIILFTLFSSFAFMVGLF
jgi:uncharacterized membrane protein